MSDFFAIVLEYFRYPFVQYAFIAGILIALCSSLLGVTLVLKRCLLYTSLFATN